MILMNTPQPRLNNTQRKALAQLVEQEYEKRINEERDKNGELIEEITRKVRVELGVDTLDNQIATLERQIKTLEEKKKQLGFSEYGHLLEGSKAKQLLEGRTKKQSGALQDIEREKQDKLARVWLAQSIEEVRALLHRVVSLKKSK